MAISIIDINVKSLIPNPNNPRRDVGDVTELADSIKEQGLQQALVVTPDHEEHGERLFRVVIGHRRLAACKLAGIERVPCVVRELDAKTERELMLVENCQRSDLTPLEEADGYQGLLDLGAGVGELAAKTGRSESFVRGRLRIARIPADVRSGSEAFAQLSLSQLGDLAEFEAYPDMMAELASMAGTKNWDWKRGQLRSRVRVEAWQQSMRTALEALGLTVDVSASTWTTPEGYRFYDVWSGEPDEFEKWYGQWREKNPYGVPVIRFSERTVLCFPQLSPEEIAERDAKSERREREQAAFQEALAARKEFDRLAYTLRTDWIRKHATGFNGGQLRKANTRLSLLALTGTNLCDGLIAGGPNGTTSTTCSTHTTCSPPRRCHATTRAIGDCGAKRTSRNCTAASTSREPRTGNSCSSCAPRSKHSSNPAHGPTSATSPSPKPTTTRSQTSDTQPATRKTRHSTGVSCPKTTRRSEP